MTAHEHSEVRSRCPGTLAVLITYCDEDELLTECLESLIGQPDGPDEIIIYDDASARPAADYVPALPHLRIVRGEHRVGPSKGRNRLLAESNSDYIHFQDADDIFLPGWADAIRTVIALKEPDVVLTEISSRHYSGSFTERALGLSKLIGEDFVRFCVAGSVRTIAGTYRATAVSTIGGYREDLRQAEDFDFHIRLAASGARFEVITASLIEVRVRRNSLSEDKKDMWLSVVQVLEGLDLDTYSAEVANWAADAGSYLYRLGLHEDSARAFGLVRDRRAPVYASQNRLYRVLARSIGPSAAERIAAGYRRAIPTRVRAGVRSRPWVRSC